ncbi:hypothetical protein [Paenibacillus eucommiae]|uniref:Multisubunit Na+/H+ antiporter MnhB subunit n=1 Tax=Paenibacillus eucommiae TaxID=1355755 RepID=A0ABS4ISZ0_9BACL|nr:hypothetical protein [Paenibacillus eucommiae]MBP1989996.1 multisubunit Na+/H+ antiporter MnhB subunit [Paenibacillus eucommiae]
MKLLAIAAITLLLYMMMLFDWPKIKRHQRREKAAFAAITVFGWGLAVLLIFFPDIHGPSQLIDAIFKPLGKTLE